MDTEKATRDIMDKISSMDKKIDYLCSLIHKIYPQPIKNPDSNNFFDYSDQHPKDSFNNINKYDGEIIIENNYDEDTNNEQEPWKTALSSYSYETQRAWKTRIERFIKFKENNQNIPLNTQVTLFMKQKKNHETYNAYASALNFYFRQMKINFTIKAKKIISHNPKICTISNRKKYFDAANDNPGMKGVLILLATCALRISELKEVFYENISNSPGYWKIRIVDSKVGQRDTYLSKDEANFVKKNWNPIFKLTGSLKPDAISKRLTRWMKKKGLEVSNPHSLRHLRISEVARKDIAFARDLAGHTNIKTTNNYVNCLDKEGRVEQFNLLLNEGGGDFEVDIIDFIKKDKQVLTREEKEDWIKELNVEEVDIENVDKLEEKSTKALHFQNYNEINENEKEEKILEVYDKDQTFSFETERKIGNMETPSPSPKVKKKIKKKIIRNSFGNPKMTNFWECAARIEIENQKKLNKLKKEVLLNREK